MTIFIRGKRRPRGDDVEVEYGGLLPDGWEAGFENLHAKGVTGLPGASVHLGAPENAPAGAPARLVGGAGDTDAGGGHSAIEGGSGDQGSVTGALIYAGEGAPDAPGKALVRTNDIMGAGPLVSDGTFLTYSQTEHVANGSTVDQLRDSLIAAGFMAAS